MTLDRSPEDILREEQEKASEMPGALSADAYVFGVAGVLNHSYWNANGKGICILAVESGGADWAAYIGADNGWSEEECVRWTVRKGCKLSREQAHRWFPQLPIEAYRE